MTTRERLFVDTTGWCALLDPSDPNHEAASLFWAGVSLEAASVVTSDFVLAETVPILRKAIGHAGSAAFADLVRSSGAVNVVYVTREFQDLAWQIYKEQRDLELSFTDCTTVTVMQQLGIEDILAWEEKFRFLGLRLRGAASRPAS